MIHGLKNKNRLTEVQKKIRNKELIGITLTEMEKSIIEGVKSSSSSSTEEEIDLEEILKEMGYYDEEKEDWFDEEDEVDELEEWLKENDEEEDFNINSLTIEELKEMINQEMINTNK
jgi:hypothetical protein